MVDVQQRPLGPLEQQLATLADGVMKPGDAVGDVRPQGLGVTEILVRDLVRIERPEVGQHRPEQTVLVGDDPLQMIPKSIGMVQVADPDTVDAAHLVAVTGADAAPRGAEVVGRRGGLLGQPLLLDMVAAG